MIRAGSSARVANRREIVGAFIDTVPKIDDPFPFAAMHHDDALQTGKFLADAQNLVQVGGVGDDHFGLAVGKAIRQGVGTEKGEKGYRYGADLVGGDMADRRFRTLGQEDSHPVPGLQAEGVEGIGQLIRKAFEILKGECVDFAGIFFIYQRRSPALMGVLVADVDPDVVEIGNVPAKTVIDLFV